MARTLANTSDPAYHGHMTSIPNMPNMTNIQKAKDRLQALEEVGYGHPAYERIALRGILHAILALHEQNETPTTKPAPTRTRATKETNK